MWVRHNKIFEISGGSQPPKSKFISQPKIGYVRLYQIRDYGSNPQPIYIPENTASKVSKKGDILLARYGASLGKVFWAEDGAYNVAMARVIALFDITLINKHYLYYYYKSSIYQETIMGNARSAQAGFNKDDLSKMFFPMPPIAEQERIVAEIEKFEPLIVEYDKLEQQATKLDDEIYDKLKKSILQYAIQGKLVPQNPNDEPASVLLERIRAEKRAELGKKYVDSYIYKGDDNCYYEHIADKTQDVLIEVPFELPNGWVWGRLDNLAIYKKGPFGSSLTKDMFVPKSAHSVKVYEQKNAIYKDCSLGSYYISEEKYNEMKNFEVFTDDIIVSCAGTIGETYVLPINCPRGIINQALMKITLFVSEMSKFYLLYFDYVLKMQAQQYSKGSAIKNIPPFEILKRMLMPLPPLAEQKRIVAKINEIFSML